MRYVGWDVRGKRLVVYAVNEQKPRGSAGEQPASRAGRRALGRQVGVGAKRGAFEGGNQMKWIAETRKTGADVPGHVVHPNEGKWITERRGQTDRGDAKKPAELARAGLLPRAVPVVEGPVRELRALVRARQQLPSPRSALINTLRGEVYHEGARLPEKVFTGPTGRAKRARLSVSAPLTVIIETFLASIEALVAAEQRRTTRGQAIQEPRWPLRESIPASGPLSARGLLSARDDARRVDDQKAVANDGARAPLFIRGGRSGSWGGASGTGEARSGACCGTGPLRWRAGRVTGPRPCNDSSPASPDDEGRKSRSWPGRGSC